MAYWLIRLLCMLIAALPRGAFAPLARFLSVVLLPLARKDLARLRQNVALIYNLPPGTHFAKLFEKQVFYHQIVSNLESIKIIQKPHTAQFSGESEFKRQVELAEQAGRGSIIISGHLGCWELLGILVSRQARSPMTVLAKRSKVRGVTKALNWLRDAMPVRILWSDRKDLVAAMTGVLTQGDALGFVMDQRPLGKGGRHVVPFLGRDTEFVAGPAAMVHRTGCAAIATYCVREAPFRYRLITKTLIASGDGLSADQTELTKTLAQDISATILRYPEQWTWNYKRWQLSPA
jgi:KDO2-lipid IV(A) lauroyltransferase